MIFLEYKQSVIKMSPGIKKKRLNISPNSLYLSISYSFFNGPYLLIIKEGKNKQRIPVYRNRDDGLLFDLSFLYSFPLSLNHSIYILVMGRISIYQKKVQCSI